MLDPAQWSFQPSNTNSPYPFDILTASGCPEVFTFTNPTENQATVDYICQWQYRYDITYFLLGSGVYGSSPVQHPTRTDLFAKRIVISGMHGQGFDGNFAEFEFAKLNVTFLTNPQGSIGGGGDVNAFITVETEASSEYMTIPGRQLVWFASGEPLNEPQQKLVTKKTHKVSVRQWFSPNFTTMDNALGKVNSSTTAWVGRTIAAKCLLFTDYHETFDTPISGFPTYKVDMTFMERPQNWNMFMNQDGDFELVDPEPYSSTSFAGIFP
jgi:hypothetical protein